MNESGWYAEFKAEVERCMLDVLSASVYPMLKDRLLFRFSTTPLTIEETVGSSEGSIVGWSSETPIPVISRLLRIGNAVKTAIPQVTQAGQWSYSSTGVPTAILTGRLPSDTVIRGQKKGASNRDAPRRGRQPRGALSSLSCDPCKMPGKH